MPRKREPKAPGSKQWSCTGRLTLDGVMFTVEGATLEEAQNNAWNGNWLNFDTATAEAVDWTLTPRTVQLDE